MGAFNSVYLSTALDGHAKTTSATVANDKTYAACGYIAPGVARYEDRSSGIPAAYPYFTMSIRRPSKTSRVAKISSKLVVPTMEVVNASTYNGITPAPTKAYESMAMFDFIFNERSTLTERQVFLNLLRSLLASYIDASDADPSAQTASPLIVAIEQYESPY